MSDELRERLVEARQHLEAALMHYPRAAQATAEIRNAVDDIDAAQVLEEEYWPEHVLALRPDAHRHLPMEESYATLVRIFEQVGRAHVAISRSGVNVPGMSIDERVDGLLLALARHHGVPAREKVHPSIETPMRIMEEKHERMLRDHDKN